MTHIFYFSALFFLIHELSWILDPVGLTNKRRKFDTLSKLNKGKKWDQYSNEYKIELKTKFPQLFLLAWLLVGLFTIQWVTFLAFLLFSFIIIVPLSKLTKYSFIYICIQWISSVIGFAFSVFVIINHYHLHINVLEYIKRFI